MSDDPHHQRPEPRRLRTFRTAADRPMLVLPDAVPGGPDTAGDGAGDAGVGASDDGGDGAEHPDDPPAATTD